MMQIRRYATIPLALAAAFAAAAAVIIMTGPLASMQPLWLMEAVMSFVAAAAWTMAALSIAPRHPAIGTMLFLPGAALSWFLSRGIVHSISPYYGLLSFMSACMGASFVWAMKYRDMGSLRGTAVSIAVPILTLVVGVTAALATPALGLTRRMWDAKGEHVWIHTAVGDQDGGRPVYIWTKADGPIASGGRVRLELDPGSGAASYGLVQLRDASEIKWACDRFRAITWQGIRQEVADGSIPYFVTRLPFRLANCEGGMILKISQIAGHLPLSTSDRDFGRLGGRSRLNG